MAKKWQPTEAQLAEMKQAVAEDRTNWSAMARQYGVGVDALKRCLMRLGICEFEGGKYLPPIKTNTQMWNRPCTVCKCTKSRPKFQYRCDRCHEKEDLAGHSTLPDEWVY